MDLSWCCNSRSSPSISSMTMMHLLPFSRISFIISVVLWLILGNSTKRSIILQHLLLLWLAWLSGVLGFNFAQWALFSFSILYVYFGCSSIWFSPSFYNNCLFLVWTVRCSFSWYYFTFWLVFTGDIIMRSLLFSLNFILSSHLSIWRCIKGHNWSTKSVFIYFSMHLCRHESIKFSASSLWYYYLSVTKVLLRTFSLN